jgi:uncharacterized membrane protein
VIASLLIAALAFVGSHIVLSSTTLRGTLRDKLGERGYLGLYSALAAVTLAWMIVAYRHAPEIVLWDMGRGARHVPLVVMPFASMLLVGGLIAPNPTAVGMERAAGADDPAPGMLRVTRHPVMWAIGLWAIAHLLATGDLGSVIFFGAFAILALGGTLLIDRKKRLALGSNWQRLAELTSNIPFAALLARRTRLSPAALALPVAGGLLLYVVLLLAHPLIAGVPALP